MLCVALPSGFVDAFASDFCALWRAAVVDWAWALGLVFAAMDPRKLLRILALISTVPEPDEQCDFVTWCALLASGSLG